MATKKLSEGGFTLVEIMIVIAIIATLAAIAIPSFLTSRINANETLAIASCRTIVGACQGYYVNILPHVYPNSLDDLAAPNSDPPYLDSMLGVRKQKAGYGFSYELTGPETFNVYGEPLSPLLTGRRYFYTNETGVIRAKTGGRAGAGDTPIN